MGGDAETWKVLGEAIPRLEMALGAEEQFGIQLPEDVSDWLTLRDAHNTIILALQSQKGHSAIEPTRVLSLLFDVIRNGYIVPENKSLDLDISFDEITTWKWKAPTQSSSHAPWVTT